MANLRWWSFDVWNWEHRTPSHRRCYHWPWWFCLGSELCLPSGIYIIVSLHYNNVQMLFFFIVVVSGVWNWSTFLVILFQIKPQENTDIMKDFDEPGHLAPTGMHLAGIKYMVIQGEPGAVIRGKKVNNYSILQTNFKFS